MNIVWSIAKLTLREAFRRTVFVSTLFIIFFLIALAPLLPAVTPAAQIRVAQSLMQSAIFYGGMLLAIALSALSVSGEIESRTIYQTLAAPVSRFKLIAGKFAGIFLTLFIIIGLWGAVSASYLYILGAQKLDNDEFARVFSARHYLEAKTIDYPHRHKLLQYHEYTRQINKSLRYSGEIPDLIGKLSDANSRVAANRRLRELTGITLQKAAITDGSSEKDAENAKHFWHEWWEKNRVRIVYNISPDERVEIYGDSEFVWNFRGIPDNAIDNGRVYLETNFFFGASYRQNQSADGRFPVKFVFESPRGEKEEATLEIRHGQLDAISFDSRLLKDGAVTVRVSAAEKDASVMVGNDKLKLIASHGSYAVNNAKHLLLMLSQFTLFAAIALCLGSIFTFPVSMLGTICLFLAGQARGFSETVISSWSVVRHDEAAERISALAIKAFYYIIRIPVPNFSALDSSELLSDGIAIPWHYLLQSWGGITIVKIVVICGICYYFFRRREIAG